MIDINIYDEVRYGSEHNRERLSVTARERVVWSPDDSVGRILVVVRGTTDLTFRKDDGLAIVFNADDNAVADTWLSGVDLPDRDARRYTIPLIVGYAVYNFVNIKVIRADFKSLSTAPLHVSLYT